MRTVYYSPAGNLVQAVIQGTDPASELAVLQGALRKMDVPDDHALCRHIDDPAQPTTLAGWKADGVQLYFERPTEATTPREVVSAQVAAALAAADAARRETAELKTQLAELLALVKAQTTAGTTAPGGS